MRLLDRLERKLGRYALPHLTVYLIAGQVAVSALGYARPDLIRLITFVPARFLEGELWRVVTFLFVPPVTNLLFAFFAWYIFYLMGSALERQWGVFRYNMYLFIACVATVAAAFIQPAAPATNAFVGGSDFLAFAFLYPDFQLYIFFVLPVKIKWLALLTWLVYAYQVLFGTWQTRLFVLASVANFLVFFGRDIRLRVRAARHRMEHQARRAGEPEQAFHRCAVCGRTEKSHPNLDFRYCGRCRPARCYCADHIRDHEHVTAETAR